MMGDNRATSEDSRFRLGDADNGSVPRSTVSARVDGVVWPLGRAGMVARTGAFAALPGDGPSGPGPLRTVGVALAAGVVLIFAGAAYGPVADRARRRRAAR